MQCVNIKRSRFIKEQQASALLSSFGIKRLLSRIPLVGPLSKKYYMSIDINQTKYGKVQGVNSAIDQ